MINPAIFKKYDIRGKFPEDINSDVIKKLVKPYIKIFNPDKIIIGHDPLEGSKEIYFPLCEEFARNGIEVFKLGEISTPMLYFASTHYNVPQGIVLTASHLGVGHSGMKIVINGVPPESEKMVEFSQEVIKDTPLAENSASVSEFVVIDQIYSDYLTKIKDVIGPVSSLDRYKVAVDVSNGPNGHVARKLFDDLNLNYVLVNEEVRSVNLAHDTNPKVAKNRAQLQETVLAHKADFGVIWDGDGDRAYFIDWNGEIIPPEFVGAVVGSSLISAKKGKKMTIDIRGASAVEQELAKVGGEVIRIQAWHVPIKFEMEKDPQVVFGMETSGHFVFRDMYKIDDGLLASMLFLAAISADPEHLRQKLTKFRSQYKIIEEINFRTKHTQDELIEKFKTVYVDEGAKINYIDGFTADFEKWRFNVRSSRTEPIIRLNISGSDFDEVDKNLERIKDIIGGEILG